MTQQISAHENTSSQFFSSSSIKKEDLQEQNMKRDDQNPMKFFCSQYINEDKEKMINFARLDFIGKHWKKTLKQYFLKLSPQLKKKIVNTIKTYIQNVKYIKSEVSQKNYLNIWQERKCEFYLELLNYLQDNNEQQNKLLQKGQQICPFFRPSIFTWLSSTLSFSSIQVTQKQPQIQSNEKNQIQQETQALLQKKQHND